MKRASERKKNRIKGDNATYFNQPEYFCCFFTEPLAADILYKANQIIDQMSQAGVEVIPLL